MITMSVKSHVYPYDTKDKLPCKYPRMHQGLQGKAWSLTVLSAMSFIQSLRSKAPFGGQNGGFKPLTEVFFELSDYHTDSY